MMVLEFLTAGHVPGRGVCLPGQNDEPEPPVVNNGTHRNQGVLPHSGPRARHVVRQQIERVDCIEIIDCNRDRAGPLFDKGARWELIAASSSSTREFGSALSILAPSLLRAARRLPQSHIACAA